MRRLAVGIDLVWLGDRGGGVGRYATELVAALIEIEPSMRLVAFIGPHAPADLVGADWAGGVEWVRLPVPDSGWPQLAARLVALPALARARRLDVLHMPSGSGPVIAPGIATVVSVHDLIWLHQGDAWESRRAQRATRRLQTHAIRRAGRLIAVSGATRDDVVATLGVAPERIDVVYSGVRGDSAVVATGEGELRARLGLGTSRVILCVAQKRQYKNLTALVRATAQLRDLDVRLVLAGAATPYEQELRTLAAQEDVTDHVSFCDWLSDGDLEGLYGLASVFVLPSLMEGFGFPVLEAMRHGVPVACSNRASLPEVVGEAALLFDPLDQDAVTLSVRRLLEDAVLAEDLRRRGFARCRELSWKRTAAGTLAVYRKASQRELAVAPGPRTPRR